jgi:SSS family transporter
VDQPFLSPGLAWFLLGAFSLLWIGLGLFWRRRVTTTNQYLFAGRNVGLALVTATLMATWVTGNTVLAAPEQAYIVGLWGMVGYAFAGFGLLFFAPLSVRIRRLMPQGFTSGDFMRLRYGRAVWAIFMFISASYFIGWLITQGMGAGLLLQALSGFDYRIGMLVVISITTIYTIFGGMRAVIGMDFIQAMMIMIGLVVVAVLAYTTYGVGEVYRGLQENQPSALNLLLPAGLLFAWNTALFSMGEVFHSNVWWMRAFASRPTVNFRGFILSGIAWLTVPLVTGSIALVALALPGEFDIPQVNMVFPVVAATVLGTVGAILVFIVVFAALASTISGLLAATATLLTEDIYRRLINPDADDERLRQVARLLVGGLGVLTIALSWNYVTTMYGLLLLTGALVGSTVWPIACGLYWEKANRQAAFVAMLLGSAAGLTFYFAVSSFAAALIAFVVSAVVMVVWTTLRPQSFDWNILRTAGTKEEFRLEGRHSDAGHEAGGGGANSRSHGGER